MVSASILLSWVGELAEGSIANKIQAHHDWHWRIPIHHLGDLATPLLERATRGILPLVAQHVEHPRGDSHGGHAARERIREEIELSYSPLRFIYIPFC